MKKLMTLVMVLGGLFACTLASAQEQEENLLAQPQEQTAKPYKVYCEIVSYSRNIFSNKTTVELDFGQYASWWSTNRQLADESGNAITFNSVLDAVNYMSRRGWEVVEVYIVQNINKGDSSDPQYHWVLSKIVTDESQITEGLRTRAK